MRSWLQAGIVTYIPFYFISYLKGDPIYAAKLVSVLLLGGTAGHPRRCSDCRQMGLSAPGQAKLAPRCLYLSPSSSFLRAPLLFVVLFFLGVVLSSTFSVTIVMAQKLLPQNLGIASGLMTGFAIGAGGIGVTLLGVVADHFSVYTALKSIAVLPVAAVILSMMLRFAPGQET